MSKILSLWLGLVIGILFSNLIFGSELLLIKLVYVSLVPVGLIISSLFTNSPRKPKNGKPFKVDL